MNPLQTQSRDPQTYAIIGAAMEVHRELGHGFLEAAYVEALSLEFAAGALPFAREVRLPILYKGRPLACHYRAEFVVFSDIIVECKAITALTNIERAQVINYFKATRFTRALLLNFGATSLEYERIVLNHKPQST